jgi:sulfoxide reductase heme-binding subunit YedZ
LLDGVFWWQNGMVTYFAAGFFALLLTIPLLLTSNLWAMKKLGKNWKKLHRATYGVAILTVVHIVLIGWSKDHAEIGPVLILVAYFIGKTLEWKGITLKKPH